VEGERVLTYNGTAQPHPQLDLLFAFQENKPNRVWGNSDLAVIKLDQPVAHLPTFKIATSEVQPGERIVLVGYGPTNPSDDTFGERHFGPNKVGWFRKYGVGSVEFVAEEQVEADGGPSAHVLDGDSGGACLSWADQSVLVGIPASRATNRRGEARSIFTSVYAHRDWLLEQ
jgi:hypothetical protein